MNERTEWSSPAANSDGVNSARDERIMISYIVRRLLLMIPTLIGITLVVFVVMAMAPGGVGAALRSEEGNMRPEQRQKSNAISNVDMGWTSRCRSNICDG